MKIPDGPFAGLTQNGYGVILCDPPWSWVSYAGKGTAPHRTAEEPYATMTAEELLALPVGDLAAKNCALIMWVIGSHIEQAIALGRHWGFEFKSDCLTWVKVGKSDPTVRPIGMGKWTRKQVEQALIFTRGKPKRLSGGVRQLIEADEVIYAAKREHSRKPVEQYERIESLVAGPYVELFARERHEEWDAWGDQVGKFDRPDPVASEFDLDDLLA